MLANLKGHELVGHFWPSNPEWRSEFDNKGWTEFRCAATEQNVLIIHGQPEGDLSWDKDSGAWAVTPDLIICCYPRRVKQKWGHLLPIPIYNDGWDDVMALEDDSFGGCHIYAITNMEEREALEADREMYRRWFPECFED